MKKALIVLTLVSIFLYCEKIEFKQTGTMAQQDINIGSSYDDPSADSARTAFDKANDNFDELYIGLVTQIGRIDDLIQQVSTPIKEVVPIGTWNMDANATKTVTWALPSNMSIRTIQVMIHGDTGLSAYPLNYTDVSTMAVQGGYYYTGSQFSLGRLTGGVFDDANYDGSGVRGYIVVEYDVLNPI